MKKLLLVGLSFILHIVGCDNSNEPDEVSTYWRCGKICDGIQCWDSSFVKTSFETCSPAGANRAHPWATKLACDDYCGDTLIFSSHTPTVSVTPLTLQFLLIKDSFFEGLKSFKF